MPKVKLSSLFLLMILESHMPQKMFLCYVWFPFKNCSCFQGQTYDVNNNFIRSVYQVPILGDFHLEWRVNAGRFRIVVENLLKSSQNIVLKLKIVASVTNVVPHFVEITQEVVPKCVNFQSLFIYLCNYFDEDGMHLTYLYPLTSFLHMSPNIPFTTFPLC